MIPISADGQEVTLSKPSPMEMMGGRYTSEKVLGEGTYGRVLLCYDRQTQRKVAVKVAQENHAYRQSALTEIEVLKSLHEIPTVPRILDTFEDAGRVCIVTELLDRNLYQVLHERRHCPLEVSDIRKVMQHILSALAALHSTGRIHCDVKPENIMLRRPEQPNNIAINNRGSDDNANRWNAVQQSPFIPLGYGNKDWASAGCGIVNSMEDLNGSFARTNTATATDRGSQVRIEQEAGPMVQAAIGSPGPFCSDVGCQNRGSHASNLYRADETNSFLSSQGPSTSTYFACNSIGTFPITGAATNTAAVTMAQPTTLPAADFDLTCLIDFGAVRKLHDNRYYDIQSLWYRAPEVLRGIPYSQSIDAWSVGCLLYELYVGRPLFSGNDEQDQFQKIHSRLLPSQSSQNLVSPGAMPADATRGFYGFVTSRRAQAVKRAVQKGFDLSGEWTVGDDLLIALMMDLLQTDETKRVSCSEALRHAFLVTDSTTMGQQLAGLKVRVASTNSMSCVGEMAASGTLRKQNSFSQMISATMPRTFAWPDRSEAGLSTSIPTVPSYPRMDDPNSLHPVNPLLHRITPTTCCTTPTGSSFLPTPTMTKGNMAVSSTTLPPPPLPSDATVFTHATFAQPACCPPQTLVMPAFPPAYPCAESDRQQMAHLQQHGAPVVYPPQLLYVQPHYSALQPQPPQLAQQVTMSQAPVPVQQAQPSHSPMMHFGAVVRTRMCAWGNRRNSHPNPKTGASLRQRIQPQQPLQVQPVSFV